MCGGFGHPTQLCASEGWVNNLDKKTPDGEDANDDGCWEEEEDETLQLEYFGSGAGAVSSPPGLHDDLGDPQLPKTFEIHTAR